MPETRLRAWSDALLLRLNEAPGRLRARVCVYGLLVLISGVDAALGVQRVSLVMIYLVPVSLAVLWLGWREGLVLALSSFVLRQAGNVLALDGEMPPWWDWWNGVMALCISLSSVWLLHGFVTLRRTLERRVEERTTALEAALQEQRVLEQAVVTISARERHAIGQELHDDLCQHLVATAFATKVSGRQLGPEHAALSGALDRVIAMMEEGVAKTRRLARGLLLASIAPERLVEEIREMVAGFDSESVRCRVIASGGVPLGDAEAAAQVFRIVQEAVRNAVRHAACSEVVVRVEAVPGVLRFIVEDDGRGLPADAARGEGMGLRIMAHRAAYVHGRWSAARRAEGGTRVCLEIPIPS